LTSPRKISYKPEGNFGLLVGGLVAIMGAFRLIKHGFEPSSAILFGTGLILVVLGAIVPRALVLPNRFWTWLSGVMSKVTTRIILSLVFYGIVTPIGALRRMKGDDPLNRRSRDGGPCWKEYPARHRDRNHYEKMY
jgi:hypothetical protein